MAVLGMPTPGYPENMANKVLSTDRRQTHSLDTQASRGISSLICF